LETIRGRHMKVKGFTLIEVLVTMVILGILLSIAVPSYNHWVLKNNVERQARELLADLNTARLDSVYRKKPHSIVLNPDNYVLKRYSSANENQISGGTAVLSKTVRYEISSMSGAFSGQHIVFDTRGFVEMGNNTIKINYSNSGAAFDCIVVSEGRTNIGKVESNVCVQK